LDQSIEIVHEEAWRYHSDVNKKLGPRRLQDLDAKFSSSLPPFSPCQLALAERWNRTGL
jgi:hypothetical protein